MAGFSRFAIFLLLLGVLAACAGPAAYAPRASGQSTGYTDRELATGRWRITFTGNSSTPRETVENYLLLRAAEVTLAAGSSHFMFDTRDTRAQTRYTTMGEPGLGPGPGWGGGWGWGRPWRFHPYWGYDPFGPDVDIVTTTSYQAFAEIVLLTPEQAAHEPRAINAREIVSHLGPSAAAQQNPA